MDIQKARLNTIDCKGIPSSEQCDFLEYGVRNTEQGVLIYNISILFTNSYGASALYGATYSKINPVGFDANKTRFRNKIKRSGDYE